VPDPLKQRVVEIRADCGEAASPRYRYGSGFIVGGNWVLTAAHVVAHAEAVRVRSADKTDRAAILDPAFLGDEHSCDLALVELTELAAPFGYVPVAAVDRETTTGDVVASCWSVGFPDFSDESDGGERTVRKSLQVTGTVPPLSRLDDGFLALRVDQPPPDMPAAQVKLADSPWSGMSGAPVFAGQALLGVIATHDTRRGSAELVATPLTFLSDPQRGPENGADWWERLSVADPEAIPRVPRDKAEVLDRPQTSERVRFGVFPDVDANFTGRDAELTMLAKAMATERRAVVRQTITGLGGVGKTQLAARYAADNADAFDVVAWVRCEAGAAADLAALCDELGLNAGAEQATTEERARRTVRWLETCGRRWLIVFDNATTADDVRPWLPGAGDGQAIVTTRNNALDELGAVVDVDVFGEAMATECLVTRAPHAGDHEQAGELARALGGLPLALAHAGAYCRDGVTFSAYQELLSDLPATAVFESDPEAAYRETVATTWKVSIDAATQRAALAAPVLQMAAYLAPDAIPIALFDSLLDDPADLAQSKRVKDAVRALARYSLIDVAGDLIAVHRLLQKVVRDDAAARDDPTGIDSALEALETALPSDSQQPTWWPQYEALLPHTDALARTQAAARSGLATVALLNAMCVYLLNAEPGTWTVDHATTAAAIAHESLGSEHLLTLFARGNLASSYWQAGRTQDAITLQEEIVDDAERLLGPEHPSTLRSRANLGSSYSDAGRTQDAIRIEERVLDDAERLLGPEDTMTLRARGNLAISYAQDGRTQEAITLLEQAVADLERLLGEKHPYTLTTRGNLANAYGRAGRTQDAIVLQEQLVADAEPLFGPEHPSTLVARGNLASSYREAGRIQDAITLQEQLLADLERLLGPEYRHTLSARGNLASSYSAAGRTQEAITLEQDVLADSERLLGPKHPSTLVARGNLANSYREAGRAQEAITLEEPVLADSERLLGREHPNTLSARANLANSYSRAGRTEDAIVLGQRALADFTRLLGPEHPDTVTVLGNLAYAYRQAGRTEDALALEHAASDE
jgi:tetratricopeptide (TPR) repeat protein